MTKTSFGKYFDDQRDRIVKDMQNNKNTELYNAWREDFDKRQMDKKEKMENFKTRILDASDYHKDHPYMKALDKALSHYVATRSLIAQGQYEKFKIDILNSLFHPQAKYDKRVESPNKK